jgi:hypothetical protein
VSGVPYSQRTNGSNTSVGGWGCRTIRLTTQGYDRRIAIFHCALEQRDLHFGISKWIRRTQVSLTVPRGWARALLGYAPAIA